MRRYKRSDVLQKHQQVKRIRRRLFEAIFEIEIFRAFMLRVNEQHTCADHLGRLDRSEQRVLKKRRPQPLSRETLIARETGEEDRWNRPLARLPLESAERRLAWSDRCCREGVIADNDVGVLTSRSDIDTRGARRL